MLPPALNGINTFGRWCNLTKLTPLVLPLVLLGAPAAAQVAKPVESVLLTWCEDAGPVAGECLSPGSIGATRDLPDDRITVLASGFWTRLDQQAQAISVLDMDDLRQVQGPDITRALQRLPGVTFTRNGGTGSFTGVSVRGSASERVLVLVDGVRMGDLASPAGGFDFGSVTAGSLERVELLRGSNALVWGADAVGGVINLSTRLPDGLEASSEYGGDGQAAGSLELGRRHWSGDAGLSASYVKRSGFSSAASGSEDDGFEQLALSARGDAELDGEFSAFASARYAASESEIDGFPAPDFTLGDTLEVQDMRQLSARAGMEYGNGIDRQALLSISHARTERELRDPATSEQPYYATLGRSTRAEARGRADLAPDWAILAGADAEHGAFSDGTTRAARGSGGAYAMLAWSPENGLPGSGSDAWVNVGLRRDWDEGFGGAWNMAANARLELAEQLHLRSSYGEGFKAPSLFQLHSDFGNPALDAERSRSFDIGLDYGDRGLSAALNAFRRDSRDLIDFVSCTGSTDPACDSRPLGTYANIGKARSQGVEAQLRAGLTPQLDLHTAYSFTRSINRQSRLQLARRPQHAGTVSLDWRAGETPLALGADMRLVSGSYDDPANTVRLGSYALLDLRAEWRLAADITLFGRAENAWDEQYQTAAGYAAQGRAAFFGVRAVL